MKHETCRPLPSGNDGAGHRNDHRCRPPDPWNTPSLVGMMSAPASPVAAWLYHGPFPTLACTPHSELLRAVELSPELAEALCEGYGALLGPAALESLSQCHDLLHGETLMQLLMALATHSPAALFELTSSALRLLAGPDTLLHAEKGWIVLPRIFDILQRSFQQHHVCANGLYSYPPFLDESTFRYQTAEPLPCLTVNIATPRVSLIAGDNALSGPAGQPRSAQPPVRLWLFDVRSPPAGGQCDSRTA